MFGKKGFLLLIPVLAGFFMALAVSAGSGPPGSSSNPVIARSYANQAWQPLQDQISALQVEVARLKEIASRDNPPKFADVPTTHWAFTDIRFMVEKGFIAGMGNGTFGPNMPARRCDLAIMVVKALNLPTANVEADFPDVPKTHWAYAHIAAAQKAGIISGFPGGKFAPNDSVTREQMAAILAKACSLELTGGTAGFKDVSKTSWAYEAIQKVADNGIGKGFEDGTFRPKKLVTRAEVAVFLAKAMDPARRSTQ